MKYLFLSITLLACSFTYAQTKKLQQCVIEAGILKSITADYDPSTGKYTVNSNGAIRPLDEVYPANGNQYAAAASWYINNETITVNGKRYLKFGLPRILGVHEIQKAAEFRGIGIYIESGTKDISEFIYLPARRGCEFQPYQQEPVQKTIYYDADWKVCTKEKAAYYRLVKLTLSGNPVGLVRDYYINGTKQWQGTLSFFDTKDNSNDVIEGVCAWFHSNGVKAQEGYYINGNPHGVYKTWAEDGSLIQEIEYKHGVLDGYIKTYSQEGRLVRTEYYKNGQPVGD